jgi:hypothetical protein
MDIKDMVEQAYADLGVDGWVFSCTPGLREDTAAALGAENFSAHVRSIYLNEATGARLDAWASACAVRVPPKFTYPGRMDQAAAQAAMKVRTHVFAPLIIRLGQMGMLDYTVPPLITDTAKTPVLIRTATSAVVRAMIGDWDKYSSSIASAACSAVVGECLDQNCDAEKTGVRANLAIAVGRVTENAVVAALVPGLEAMHAEGSYVPAANEEFGVWWR